MSSVTPENVLAKIKTLSATHEKLGNHNRLISIDTLALLFQTSQDHILALLKTLEASEEVTISYRTIGAKKTGKNPVMFVTLAERRK